MHGNEELTADRRTPSWASAASLVGIALAAAYLVLWLGGAYEAVVADMRPAGEHCSFWLDSDIVAGVESSDWTNGGMAFRPGRVCTHQGSRQLHLSDVDVAAGAMSVIAFVATLSAGWWWLFARRDGAPIPPGDRDGRSSSRSAGRGSTAPA